MPTRDRIPTLPTKEVQLVKSLGIPKGSAYKEDRATALEKALVELHNIGMEPLKISQALGLPLGEVVQRLEGWNLLSR